MICCKGAGSDSILDNVGSKWVHRRCSGIRGKLHDVISFECAVLEIIGWVRCGRPKRVVLGVCG